MPSYVTDTVSTSVITSPSVTEKSQEDAQQLLNQLKHIINTFDHFSHKEMKPESTQLIQWIKGKIRREVPAALVSTVPSCAEMKRISEKEKLEIQESLYAMCLGITNDLKQSCFRWLNRSIVAEIEQSGHKMQNEIDAQRRSLMRMEDEAKSISLPDTDRMEKLYDAVGTSQQVIITMPSVDYAVVADIDRFIFDDNYAQSVFGLIPELADNYDHSSADFPFSATPMPTTGTASPASISDNSPVVRSCHSDNVQLRSWFCWEGVRERCNLMFEAFKINVSDEIKWLMLIQEIQLISPDKDEVTLEKITQGVSNNIQIGELNEVAAKTAWDASRADLSMLKLPEYSAFLRDTDVKSEDEARYRMRTLFLQFPLLQYVPSESLMLFLYRHEIFTHSVTLINSVKLEFFNGQNNPSTV